MQNPSTALMMSCNVDMYVHTHTCTRMLPFSTCAGRLVLTADAESVLLDFWLACCGVCVHMVGGGRGIVLLS